MRARCRDGIAGLSGGSDTVLNSSQTSAALDQNNATMIQFFCQEVPMKAKNPHSKAHPTRTPAMTPQKMG